MIYLYGVVGVFFILLFSYLIAPILLGIVLIGIIVGLLTRDRSFTQENNPSHIDHHIHVPIQTVPEEYHKAYAIYLKSPEWRAFRKLVLKRDKYRCVDCGVRAYHSEYNPTGKKLQVHHIHYDGIETMTFSTDQCASVCHECHERRHRR